MENMFTASHVSRFILTHSKSFGTTGGTDTLTHQAKVSLWKCHMFVPNLGAIQQSSSHHSIHQNSDHNSIRHRSNHHSRKNVRGICLCRFPNVRAQDLRDPLSMFLPLCTPLAPWFALLVPLDVPLDFPLISLLLPLPGFDDSLLDHDLLCLPLPLRLLACAITYSLVEMSTTVFKTPIAWT